jgi:hypothetical protein
MTFAKLAHLFSTLLDFLRLLGRSDQEKDLEILLVRQQLRRLQRTRTHPPRLAWWGKAPLAMLVGKLVQRARHSRARLSQASSCSRLKPCCGGTTIWCDVNGPFTTNLLWVDRVSQWNLKR